MSLQEVLHFASTLPDDCTAYGDSAHKDFYRLLRSNINDVIEGYDVAKFLLPRKKRALSALMKDIIATTDYEPLLELGFYSDVPPDIERWLYVRLRDNLFTSLSITWTNVGTEHVLTGLCEDILCLNYRIIGLVGEHEAKEHVPMIMKFLRIALERRTDKESLIYIFNIIHYMCLVMGMEVISPHLRRFPGLLRVHFAILQRILSGSNSRLAGTKYTKYKASLLFDDADTKPRYPPLTSLSRAIIDDTGKVTYYGLIFRNCILERPEEYYAYKRAGGHYIYPRDDKKYGLEALFTLIHPPYDTEECSLIGNIGWSYMGYLVGYYAANGIPLPYSHNVQNYAIAMLGYPRLLSPRLLPPSEMLRAMPIVLRIVEEGAILSICSAYPTEVENIKELIVQRCAEEDNKHYRKLLAALTVEDMYN